MLSKAQALAASRGLAFCACAAFASILCACAADEPEIAEVAARRILIQDEAGAFSPALSVFALFAGGGEAGDFSLMTVTHSETGIFWEVPASSSLVFPGANGYSWVGSSRLSAIPSILMKEDDETPWGTEGFFPKGAYTVEVDNAAGSSATASFELAAPFYFAGSPAVFRLSGEGEGARWNVVLSQDLSPREVAVFIFLLDEAGSPLSSIRITQKRFRGRRAEGSIGELAQSAASKRADAPAVAAASCYVEHVETGSAVLLFPLDLGKIGEK